MKLRTAEEALVGSRINQDSLTEDPLIKPFLVAWGNILDAKVAEGKTQYSDKNFHEYTRTENGDTIGDMINPDQRLSLFGLEYRTGDYGDYKYVDVDVILNIIRRQGFTVSRHERMGITISWHTPMGT